jgi:hypothetical protein
MMREPPGMPRWLPRVLARIHRLAAEGIAQIGLYVKVVLRTDCVVISFHEEGGDDDPAQGEGQQA